MHRHEHNLSPSAKKACSRTKKSMSIGRDSRKTPLRGKIAKHVHVCPIGLNSGRTSTGYLPQVALAGTLQDLITEGASSHCTLDPGDVAALGQVSGSERLSQMHALWVIRGRTGSSRGASFLCIALGSLLLFFSVLASLRLSSLITVTWLETLLTNFCHLLSVQLRSVPPSAAVLLRVVTAVANKLPPADIADHCTIWHHLHNSSPEVTGEKSESPIKGLAACNAKFAVSKSNRQCNDIGNLEKPTYPQKITVIPSHVLCSPRYLYRSV